jgi:hypothetical protein
MTEHLTIEQAVAGVGKLQVTDGSYRGILKRVEIDLTVENGGAWGVIALARDEVKLPLGFLRVDDA